MKNKKIALALSLVLALGATLMVGGSLAWFTDTDEATNTFAMGSVETYGKDRIEQHSHPHLEQYFFSLAENNCIALIDDLQYPFGPNSVLHIPLGSNHGIHLDDEHSCHYLWIDFLLNEEALEYLDTAHTIVE